MSHDLTEQPVAPQPSATGLSEAGCSAAQCAGSSRRAMLRTVGVGGAAVAVGLAAAACTTASATSNPAGAGASSANPAPTGDSTLGPASSIPVGGGIIYQDAKVVVTQPTAGTYKAFSAVCTHMQCIVGSVSDNVITCPCHGSQYSAITGDVERGPATQALPAASITVSGGNVTLS
jgi:Rieske Fe-S protein